MVIITALLYIKNINVLWIIVGMLDSRQLFKVKDRERRSRKQIWTVLYERGHSVAIAAPSDGPPTSWDVAANDAGANPNRIPT